MSKHDRLVWIDLEMTGLDPDHHVVVEVAALVTGADYVLKALRLSRADPGGRP